MGGVLEQGRMQDNLGCGPLGCARQACRHSIRNHDWRSDHGVLQIDTSGTGIVGGSRRLGGAGFRGLQRHRRRIRRLARHHQAGRAGAGHLPPGTVDSALSGLSYDPKVIKADRNQNHFKQSFEQFSGRMIPPRMKRAKNMLNKHASTLSRIEQQYGVPAEVVVAIWGLETDFGAVQGQRLDAALARDARLRLPPLGLLHRAADRRAPHHRPRRPDAGADARRPARRARPDAVPALLLRRLRGRFRRQRPARPPRQHGGRARPRPPTTCAAMAGSPASPGWRARGNFQVIKAWNKSQVYSQTVAEFARRLARDEVKPGPMFMRSGVYSCLTAFSFHKNPRS